MAPMPPPLRFLDARRQASSEGQGQLDAVTLAQSSLELDKRSADVSSSTSSSLEATKVLAARDGTSTYVPGAGTKPATAFNNAGFQALFAILGAAMVIAALWFFFWAKNGGFHYQQGDWDDYKSTVLRRKGPDGKTLSNATKSTKLGGSTIAGTQHYKWQKQAARSVVGRDEKGRKGVRAKRGWAKTHSVLYSDDYMTESFGTETVSDMTELRTEPDTSGHHSKRYRDRDVQQYKKEKPARVGGLNRVADGNGSHFGTTIAGSETMSETSEQPLIQKNKEKEKERAERKAREMERRWRREAEEAAAALARENAASRPPPPPAHTAKKSAAPSSSKPAVQKQRRDSRSSSPKKRDFSYNAGPASEVLSTAYTGSTTTGTTTTGGTRTASYYEEYRPRASENPRYSSDHGKRSRQSSPRKGGGGAARKVGREGGYRRGADSDLD
ncbi:hypothetical protein LTR85_002448 [Meristemomyces frigidus]|nr:hypothetical protein LTR85_002448 [Meristemomyces frigidus]